MAKLQRDFLLPVRVIGALFRGKLLAHLRDAYEHGRLDLGPGPGRPGSFRGPARPALRTDWVVYAKRPFGGAEQVVRYLGRYTHRVGISNQRLVSLKKGEVTFRTKNGKTLTLSAHEFLARFVQHVLPSGFVKIRHYGLMAPSHATTTLETARQLLIRSPQRDLHTQAPIAPVPAPDLPWRQLLRDLTGVDLGRCPACGAMAVVRRPLETRARAPPEAA